MIEQLTQACLPHMQLQGGLAECGGEQLHRPVFCKVLAGEVATLVPGCCQQPQTGASDAMQLYIGLLVHDAVVRARTVASSNLHPSTEQVGQSSFCNIQVVAIVGQLLGAQK